MAMTRQVAFSSDRHYRYWLQRCWNPDLPRLLFVGLNPSSADADRDDPTLRRLMGFARVWGFGQLDVVNLFALCSVSPALLRRSKDPVGEDNDQWLKSHLMRLRSGLRGCPRESDALLVGWGNGGCWRQRDQQVLDLIAEDLQPEVRLLALGFTASGQPRHPLYVPSAAPPFGLHHPGMMRRLELIR